MLAELVKTMSFLRKTVQIEATKAEKKIWLTEKNEPYINIKTKIENEREIVKKN